MLTVGEQVTLSEPIVDLPHLITNDHFRAMVERGVFPEENRVFFWGGRLYEKMAKALPHPTVCNALIGALWRRMPSGLFLGAENPVRLEDYHLPLPDDRRQG